MRTKPTYANCPLGVLYLLLRLDCPIEIEGTLMSTYTRGVGVCRTVANLCSGALVAIRKGLLRVRWARGL